ncbi:MAG: hypothetical protein ACFFFG_15920 [Candidatus Thorarchaeota archaeon]
MNFPFPKTDYAKPFWSRYYFCSGRYSQGMFSREPQLSIPIHGQKQEMKKFKTLLEKVLLEIDVILPEKFKLSTVFLREY